MQVGCDLYAEQDTWDELCNLVVVFKPAVCLVPLHGIRQTLSSSP